MGNQKFINRIAAGVSAASIASLALGSVLAIPANAAPAEVKVQATGTAVTTTAPPQATDRFVVKFSGATEANAVARDKTYDKVTSESGVALDEVKTTATGSQVVTAGKDLSKAEADKVLVKLNADPNVVSAEPDVIALPEAFEPTDDLYPSQWHLNEELGGLRVSNAWKKTTGTGQVVAVIDTGITSHSDLNGSVLPGYDMISDANMGRDGNGRDANPLDEGDWQTSTDCSNASVKNSSWHGTHVAGIIAAAANGAGTVGVAPNANILPIRALGACGGYMSDISDGIIWASGGAVNGVPANPNPARVINLSLSSTGVCPSYVQSAINTAVGRGSAVFVAAGNYNSPTAGYSPANCNNVITVASSSRNGAKAGYSNYGPEVDITAPGGDASSPMGQGILSTFNAGTTVPGAESYKTMQGTSMASPVAASLGALLFANNPTLTPATMEARLKETARALPGVCGQCGAGLIDAAAAFADPIIETVGATPVITGNAKVGSVLTAAPGAWNPVDMDFTYVWKRNGTPITGAVTNTYSALEEDYSKVITVEVTGSKTGYTTVVKESGPVVVIEGELSAPKPTITGTVSPDNVVHAEAGAWALEPTTVEFQWNLNDTPIPGATEADYTVSLNDIGKNLTVSITAGRYAYNSTTVTSTSVTVGDATMVSGPVTISGEAKFGNTLTAVAPEWSPKPVTLGYQWQRSGVDIAGASSATYALKTDDIGKTITVSVTGTKAGYNAVTVVSAATKTVASGTLKNAGMLITGTAKVGSTIAVSVGDFGVNQVALSYQWKRSGVNILGANKATYALIGSDAGKQLTVTVTGAKAGYTSVTVTSGAVTVAAGTLLTGQPTISGTSKVGYVLTARPGIWSTGAALSYQWYRSGAAISGAKASTYGLVAADAGKRITVRVTGTLSGYTNAYRDSGSTSLVAAGTLVKSTPAIVGTLKSGYTLTASPGKWTSGTGFFYQWYSSGKLIKGATGKSYRLTGADRADTIRVFVTGVKSGYLKASMLSLPTGRVR